ncbi:cyanophycin metabolism-associated DUF1854 family protein [Sapientia aquatica]|uniref:DUF1854 domain-containing protein n=1 Tax=Sapientia aquatica TaxID=1549640 RepID=A0A4R5W5A4_9BURK|nr:DUF1854 domain-containing protein [Sapientia aquatica]TDK68219.1 DUF1854 domain-containing protein [Sapientia aquatica]
MQTTQFDLTRNSFGKLMLTANGETHEGVTPVRAFPIQTPEEGIALVSTDGREVAWVERLVDLPQQVRDLITNELAGREFVPVVDRIIGVSSFSTPCTWTVATDRGETNFVLRVEEDIRRVGESLLVTDNHGINFLIRNPRKLDKHSRKILDRFL